MADQKDFNRQLIDEFRASRSSSDTPMNGRPLLLLTTTGAKSGQKRTTPVMYIQDGDRVLVVASNAGAQKHPDWYRNLEAQPEVTVEVGPDTYAATASIVQGDEREQVWSRIVQQYAFFAEHQAKTSRQIPVVALQKHKD